MLFSGGRTGIYHVHSSATYLCKLPVAFERIHISLLCRPQRLTCYSCPPRGHEQNSVQLQLEHNQEASILNKMLTLSSHEQKIIAFLEKSKLLLVCYANGERGSHKYASLSVLMQNVCLDKINPSVCTYLGHLMLSCPSVLC